MKTCPRCDVNKENEEFSTNPSRRDKLNCYCRPCAREYGRDIASRRRITHPDYQPEYNKRYYSENRDKVNAQNRKWAAGSVGQRSNFITRLRREYSLSVEDFAWLLHGQGFKCGGCMDPLDVTAKRGIHVDHCHDSGLVRGLLCAACNKSLGAMRDDETRLLGLAAYARKHAHLKTVILA